LRVEMFGEKPLRIDLEGGTGAACAGGIGSTKGLTTWKMKSGPHRGE